MTETLGGVVGTHPFSDPLLWIPSINGERIEPTQEGGLLVLLKNPKGEASLDKKKPQGAHGAVITGQGLELETFELEFSAWNDRGTSKLTSIIQTLREAQASTRPVVIEHPALEVLCTRGVDCTRALVESISPPMLDDQLVVASVAFTRWAPPARVAGAGARSVASTPSAINASRAFDQLRDQAGAGLPPATMPASPSASRLTGRTP